jgi:DNA-binding IclR family transcriptional regulator
MSLQSESGGAQRRGYRILLALAGHEIDGLSNAEIADAIGAKQSTTFRDLQVLKDVGLAERIEITNRWRLAPKLVQIALAHMRTMERAEKTIEEVGQRYSRTHR